MKDKINIAELLKDFPKGMELDCTIWDNIVFEEIDGDNIVISRKSVDSKVYLTQYGELSSVDGKCVIFPKGKTTWEEFQRPFKDGDVIYNRLQKKICIYYLFEDEVPRIKGCRYNESNPQQFEKLEYPIPIAIQDYRLATREEQVKFFKAIENNGYRWNEKAKTLEKLIKPIFKKGDKVRVKKGFPEPRIARVIEDVCDTFYTLVSVGKIDFTDQNNWELIPNKFDITTLKPFESRVLVRDANCYEWEADIFGRYSNGYIALGGGKWEQCIPYEGNEHLLGTTNDCDDFYKTWQDDKTKI